MFDLFISFSIFIVIIFCICYYWEEIKDDNENLKQIKKLIKDGKKKFYKKRKRYITAGYKFVRENNK